MKLKWIIARFGLLLKILFGRLHAAFKVLLSANRHLIINLGHLLKNTPVTGPLKGLKILDLSRVLAGPWATQVLADFGATVWKIERPKVGDDTRRWGKDYGEDLTAYFLSANRGKQSITVDFTTLKGQQIIIALVKKADVLVENFKVGNLKKYHLDYESLNEINPQLVYCSITGFGQTGPYANQAGYDAMIQASAGLMSVTGEADGAPQKVGVAVSDLMTGMYAVSAILSAIYHRDSCGEGQWIDLSLFDTQVSWLANQAMDYLMSGNVPTRQGNAHPSIAPYQPVKCGDGFIMLAIGNDQQFQRFCGLVNLSIFNDSRFSTNNSRVKNKAALIEILEGCLAAHHCDYWLKLLSDNQIPCGAINDLEQVFSHPQINYRDTHFSLKQSLLGDIPQVANPVKFSKTPISYTKAAPALGEDSELVLTETLGFNESEIGELKRLGVI